MHALQLATQSLPGALSPRLREFAWYHATDALLVFGREFSKLLAPHMDLFLGENVRYLEADNVSQTDPPLHSAAIDSSIKRLRPQLKGLTVQHVRKLGFALPTFATGWEGLESLSFTDAPVSLIPHLASLPLLKKLKIMSFSHAQGTFSVSDPNPTAEGFPSLQNLELATESFNAHLILSHLGSVNRIETFEWAEDKLSPIARCQDLICTAATYFNRRTLRSFSLWHGFGSPDTLPAEALDADPEQINISPLHVFPHLEVLNIGLTHTISLTPNTSRVAQPQVPLPFAISVNKPPPLD
jgi:hypothetical protein